MIDWILFIAIVGTAIGIAGKKVKDLKAGKSSCGCGGCSGCSGCSGCGEESNTSLH